MSLLAAIFILSSCSAPTTIKDRIIQQLDSEARHGFAEVDLRQTVEGEWTELVIVCQQTMVEEVEATLGFTWEPEGAFLPNSSYTALVFSTGEGVESVVQFEPGDSISFCQSSIPGSFPRPRVVGRDDAVFGFELVAPDDEDPIGLGYSKSRWVLDTESVDVMRE